jgi:6-pyruvoyltetrahydropterin/6-carboxytetrahydropterin synthase
MQYVFLEYSIDCAHFLPNVPEGHKCGTMHGHRYEIRLEVAGVPAKASGWIIDYAEIKVIADPVIMALDHQTLNTVLGLENPTCENLVGHILQLLVHRLPDIWAIEVRETDRGGAGWRRS